ncbi:hypothetical protein E1B28_010236 [Marasmius oreades]|uniref:Uncharacterized protein n=1 Tax=Marasmius oreades TaxID=181124 RepID=A0A9P7RWW4_9AGAR|nr:uncharacterized protein E1B28_010236 [Marasmius oreades]KAG7091185.1 hypothetical protein E1B28_010236 [Marasmius oreades]
MTGSAMEITWRHWSSIVEDDLNDTKDSQKTDENFAEQYELRPVWQRAGLCSAFFAGGVVAASAILIARVRFLRILDVFPPLEQLTSTTKKSRPSMLSQIPKRHIFIQSSSYTRGRGVSFPLSRCVLHEGRDDTELFLEIAGERGHWYIGLHGALINGRKSSPLEARDAIIQQWEGGTLSKELANPLIVDGRWKKGPIVA